MKNEWIGKNRVDFEKKGVSEQQRKKNALPAGLCLIRHDIPYHVRRNVRFHPREAHGQTRFF